VSAARDRIVALIESINQPQISIPGRPPQCVQGYLCGLRNANGTFSVYVSLFLPESAENVVYVHEPRELAVDGYRAAEAEGLHFLESMGFMLDNLNFRNLAPEQQESHVRHIPMFSRPVAAARPPPAAPTRTALARLLASF
jgi:hypothetical protein